MHRLSVLAVLWMGCGQSDPAPVADAGAPSVDAGPARCGSAGADHAEGLVELKWDDDTVGTEPYNAMGLNFMTSRYVGTTKIPAQHEQWEAVRFEWEHPARVHAIKVRMTALGNLREDDEWVLGLYGDFGNNGFDFDQWNPLWTGTRCGEDIERDAWVTYALDEPLVVDTAGLIYVANHRQSPESPQWVFAQNRSAECAAWDDCHSAWNFPTLDERYYNGASFPLPYNYAVRLMVEYTEQADPETHRFVPREDLELGSRSAWGDYDQDGWDDVVVGGVKLYRNLGDGRFEDVTVAAGLEGVGGSAVWGDLDNDGCLDLVAYGGEERVMRSTCDGQSSESARALRLGRGGKRGGVPSRPASGRARAAARRRLPRSAAPAG